MIERVRERRKIVWAILASILVHLVVAYSLAAFSAVFTPAAVPDVEEQPPEMTLVDLAPAAPVEKNPGFIETDPSRATEEKPKEQTYESNANSVGASEVPATGDAPLPSQQGKDRPFVNLQTQQYREASEGAKAQPENAPRPTPPPATPAPKSTPVPSAVATAKPSEPPKTTPPPPSPPEPEQFAMLRATPPPPLQPPEEADTAPSVAPETTPPIQRPKPERPGSEFQAQKEQTRITGRITNKGPSSVNAVGTPLGRYQKSVSDAIGSRWYHYMKGKIDLVSIGTAHVAADIGPDGRIQNLRVLSNNANEAFANICLQSFEEAKLPPIPPDLVSLLPDGHMPVDIYFTTYAQ